MMDTVANVSDIAGLQYQCSEKSPGIECQFKQFWIDNKSVQEFTQSFERDRDGSWIAEEQSGGPCGGDVVARFVKAKDGMPGGNNWNYTTEKTVRYPERKDFFGSLCSKYAYDRKTYEWHSKTWDANCRTMTFK